MSDFELYVPGGDVAQANTYYSNVYMDLGGEGVVKPGSSVGTLGFAGLTVDSSAHTATLRWQPAGHENDMSHAWDLKL